MALPRVSLGQPMAIYELREGASFGDPHAVADYDLALYETMELVFPRGPRPQPRKSGISDFQPRPRKNLNPDFFNPDFFTLSYKTLIYALMNN